MHPTQPAGPSIDDWAHTNVQVTKLAPKGGGEAIFELRKELIVNGVRQLQFVWLNQKQLRSIGIDHGL